MCWRILKLGQYWTTDKVTIINRSNLNCWTLKKCSIFKPYVNCKSMLWFTIILSMRYHFDGVLCYMPQINSLITRLIDASTIAVVHNWKRWSVWSSEHSTLMGGYIYVTDAFLHSWLAHKATGYARRIIPANQRHWIELHPSEWSRHRMHCESKGG